MSDADTRKRDELFRKTYNLQRRYLNNVENPPSINEINNIRPLLLQKKYLLLHYNTMMAMDTNIFISNYSKCITNINNLSQSDQQSNEFNDGIRGLAYIVNNFEENIEFVYINFKVSRFGF